MRLDKMFSEEDRKAVADAVAKAESKTSGEIVPVVAAASGRYGHGAALAAFAAAVIAGAACGLVTAAVTFLVALAVADRLPVLKILFTPKADQVDEVRRAAAAAYQRFRVGRTSGSTGVLIYISLAERMARVVGDGPIADKVEDKDWEALCGQVTVGMAARRPAYALCAGVIGAGDLLATHFPAKAGDVDELKNELHLIDGLP